MNITVKGSSDHECVKCPFFRTCDVITSWGAKNQNDWVEVDFDSDLLYITHYSIAGSASANRAKGWSLDASKKGNEMRKIDTVNNGLQTTDTEVHKINLSGPFSAFRFTVTESYDPSKSWYGEIYRIDFFGVLNPDKHLLNKIYRNTCKSKQSTFLSKTLLILELVLCK